MKIESYQVKITQEKEKSRQDSEQHRKSAEEVVKFAWGDKLKKPAKYSAPQTERSSASKEDNMRNSQKISPTKVPEKRQYLEQQRIK